MSDISTDLIKQAVYKLCFDANICLNKSVYFKIKTAYEKLSNIETKNILKSILENAKIAYEKRLPLCQDTGQVIVFLEIGQEVKMTGEYIEIAINQSIEKCYKDNYFRKSVVKNAIFDRKNTKTNTPCVIHTKIIEGNKVNIKLLIKGAGSENKSRLEMLMPTIDRTEFIQKCGEIILSAAENACPPMFVGIGAGLTMEGAALLSKEALVTEVFSEEELNIADEIKTYVNSIAPNKYKDCFVLDIKLLSRETHIACLPLAITLNCHSDRFSSCSIINGNIIYNHQIPDFIEQIPINEIQKSKKYILTDDINDIKALKAGEKIFLTGEIYVARDMAHKRLIDFINQDKTLPFNIKNKIIFYAGPCPAKSGEIIGSIGPTTASRMDKYAKILYEKGLIATIGKGNRSIELLNIIKSTGAKYFTAQGGIAALLSQYVEKSEIIAFEDLGTEAIYKLYVKNLPLNVEI